MRLTASSQKARKSAAGVTPEEAGLLRVEALSEEAPLEEEKAPEALGKEEPRALEKTPLSLAEIPLEEPEAPKRAQPPKGTAPHKRSERKLFFILGIF